MSLGTTFNSAYVGVLSFNLDSSPKQIVRDCKCFASFDFTNDQTFAALSLELLSK